MKRGLVFALAAALSACAPTPVQMPAAQASEMLSLFAAGEGPANVCSADGRALLRGAVRSYAREMWQAGVDWPVIPEDAAESENVTSVDISVMIAFAAGFVKSGDFQHGAPFAHLALLRGPEVRSMRNAARIACDDVRALQQAAARLVIEQSRLAQMTHARSESDRLRRQTVLVERTRTQMWEMAAVVEARMRAAEL